MKTFSINRTVSVGIAMLALVTLFALIIPMSASADTVGLMNSNSGKGPSQRQDDNKPYLISGIRSCVSSHIPSDTGSTTSETITKAKGDALINCIKNARQRAANNSAIEELLKKIEELRKQIQALKNN